MHTRRRRSNYLRVCMLCYAPVSQLRVRTYVSRQHLCNVTDESNYPMSNVRCIFQIWRIMHGNLPSIDFSKAEKRTRLKCCIEEPSDHLLYPDDTPVGQKEKKVDDTRILIFRFFHLSHALGNLSHSTVSAQSSVTRG